MESGERLRPAETLQDTAAKVVVYCAGFTRSASERVGRNLATQGIREREERVAGGGAAAGKGAESP